MRIGDLLFRILADDSGFEADLIKKVDKAGASAEKTLGARINSSLKSDGVRAFGAVATVAFGLAAKGALQLQDVQARITAETGAGADEALAAAKAINKAAGTERMSLEQVTDIAVRVRRDIGAVGPAADNLTARFARFARVTRQDPVTAVTSFDDILDKWSLTADAVPGLQDKILVGWQKWGGTIEGNEQALSANAAQLRALNLNVDDGIALINLFNASGLDATNQTRALNTAVKNLKPGQSLGDLIKQIASIEDPTLRAQAAIKIFGARGGVDLANALHPGINGLDDFRVSTEDATNATDKAADALDSTWSAKVKKVFSEASAAVRDFGFSLGGAFQATGALISAVATLGGGKLFKGLAGGLKNAVSDAVVLMRASNTIPEGIAAIFQSLPGYGPMKTAASKLGTFLGTTVGKATAVSLAGLLLLEVIQKYNEIKAGLQAQVDQIKSDVGTEIATGSTEDLRKSAAALAAARDKLFGEAKSGNPFAVDPFKQVLAEYDAVQAELDKRAAAAEADERNRRGANGLAGLDAIAAEAARQAAFAAGNEIGLASPYVAEAAKSLALEIPTTLEKNTHLIAEAAKRFLALPIGEQLVKIGPTLLRAAGDAALQVASGFRDRRSAIDSAIDQLKTDIKNRLTPSKEEAHDLGLLLSKDVAHGLHDGDPEVRAQAEGTRSLIEAELIDTINAGGSPGKKIMDQLTKDLKSKDPDVRAQAQRTKSLIDQAHAAEKAKTPGQVIGDQLSSDLANADTTLGRTAYSLGQTIATNLLRGVKDDGPLIPSIRPAGVPHQVPINSFDSGTWSVPGDQYAFIHNREIIVPRDTADAVRSGAAVIGTPEAAGAMATDGDVFNLFLPDARHTDPWAVLDRVPRYAKIAKAEVADTGWQVAS